MKKINIKNVAEEYYIGKIVCVGRNYTDHVIELGNEVPEKPILFLKPSSAVIFSGENIKYPSYSKEMHHEAELVLLIGEELSNADETESGKAIAGYAVGLDMTLRDIQNELKKKGHPWTIAKCFDTSAVLSDFVSSKEYKLTLDEQISLSVNGELRQREKLNQMIFSPSQLVQYISSIMKLERGDIIFTGTPAGVGKVNKGDVLRADIKGVGELTCKVE
ncbi:MAG: fumarylacetoacetate hydrolase family protein [Ignavibacteriaceae bacterium]|nr:fumarylacetoacetate hydrolase family protein [Ignavibacteriaceae bacterium]